MRTDPLLDDDNPCRPRHFKPSPIAETAVEGDRPGSLEVSRNRLLITGIAFSLAFAVVGVRLVAVTLTNGGAGGESKLGRITAVAPVVPGRADILDRNGSVMATTLTSPSLFANPQVISDPADAAKQLAKILPNASQADLLAKLNSDKSFVWLQRRLTAPQQEAVNRLGIPGLEFQREDRRIYPDGPLAAHVVGYSGLDNKGLAGMERSFDGALSGQTQPLQLSIDIRLQNIVREELANAVTEFSAIGATGIVMDVKSGEVLSMVSLPDFDPNKLNTVVPATIFNRATLGTYEMGSTFKIFNTALALENRKATLTSMFDATHPISYGRFTIHDDEPKNRYLSVAEIFMYSSNIGSVRMVQESGIEAQKDFLGRLGLLKPAVVELPEIGTPLVPSPWRDINSYTIAFGHGLSVSPIQMATAVSAIVNGGILRPATLIKQPLGADVPGQRVISAKTSEEMRRLLRLVVTDGTGKSVDVPGYLVGGKTGSAEKSANHGYAKHALLTSFIAAFPINDPKYLVMVMLDEPKGTKKTFGFALAAWNAGPTAGRVIARMAPLFGLKPVDETPEIHRAISVDIPGLGKKIAAN
ncbi:MAG TPA: penicillin-binding protein 2 [Stellaceae bacterium]|nr:penicillin-binding protein 2 [Stellaceae bacterium]